MWWMRARGLRPCCFTAASDAIKSAAEVSVGVPAATTRRPVVDASYDVALIVVCQNVAAEAAYQVDPIHLAFVEKFKTFWSRVQIYDSE